MRPLLSAAIAYFLVGSPVQPRLRADTPPLDPQHAAKMARGLDIFKKDVRPLLVQHCLACHGGKTTEGELDIADRDALLKGGNGGPAVAPYDAKKSLLYRLVNHERKPFMPHEAAKLPEAAVTAIAAWIDNGAPYDAPLVKREDATAWTRKVVPADARRHWAYQPLAQHGPPAVNQRAWIKNPIDSFILQRLEGAGLKPNAPAGPRQLIRRAHFDLTGLPPTPDEVDSFVRDYEKAPDETWGKLIDRLLASQHYGERWARHWLDLARFAESHGFEHDYDRPTAYHYRDFVIQALNRDLPYDTFVKWQIAGDEIAPDEKLALMATGFLAAGVHSTQITKNEVEKHRYDELDDMLATTGTAMLGLTVGCARCHDHKYDAIPSRDYYRMLATFTTTVRTEVELERDPERYRAAKAVFDREHEPFEAALRKFEAEQLPARFAEWQRGRTKESLENVWLIPEVASMKSSGGSTLTKQDDGSILLSGKNPTMDTLTITVNSNLKDIRAVRIEALTHPSLVKNGPGRASNGNFALTDFKVTAAAKGGKPLDVKLRNPRSTFDQRGLGVAGAIDLDAVTTAWAIDPQFGKDHAATFEFEESLGFDGGATLTFTLKFNNNVGHGMGRPRLSLAAGPNSPALTAPAVSEVIATLAALPAEKRTADQTASLMKWYRHLDPEWTRLNKVSQEHLAKAPKRDVAKTLISSEGLPAIRLHSQGEDFFPQTYFLKRGDTSQKEGAADSGYLQVLSFGDEKKWSKQAPLGSRLSYRRTAFADWLTDVDDGAGRLLARVIVNRLWQRHFGKGIVSTVSDFGIRGEPPSHPELLDYLARELIRNEWRLKPIHRLIMTSTAYRQNVSIEPDKAIADKRAALFGRQPVRRLEAEVIRDSLLAVSGLLDDKMFGPGTLDEASRRRSIYFTMKRSKLIPSLIIFDAPDGTTGLGERPSTTIAPQALHLLNNSQVREYAKGLARRATRDDIAGSIREAYRITLGRDPTPTEVEDALAFVRRQVLSYGETQEASAKALTDFCQVLLCLNEFVYVE